MHTSKELAQDFTKLFRKRTLVNMEVINNGAQLQLIYEDNNSGKVFQVLITLDGVDEVIKIGLAARSLLP